MKKTALRALTAATLAVFAINAPAATNPGAPSAGSSQGDFLITLNLTPFMIVNGFDDMTLNATSNSDISQADDICVGGFGFAAFDVALESANGTAKLGTPDSTAPFLLLNGATSESIPYSVTFSKGAETDTSGDGTFGISFTRNASDTIGNCTGGGNNAAISIGVNAADWQTVEGQAFTDTLIVQIEPA